MLNQKTLKAVLSYDCNTGVFRWVSRTSNRIKIGDVAGCPTTVNGYSYIGIQGQIYLAHRLAFLYMEGVFPPNQVDHIDRNRKNNRWENLRTATNAENCRNRTGVIGVYENKKTGGWYASIGVEGKSKYLGYFKTKEDALKARQDGENKYW